MFVLINLTTPNGAYCWNITMRLSKLQNIRVVIVSILESLFESLLESLHESLLESLHESLLESLDVHIRFI